MSTYEDLEREYTRLKTQWESKHGIFSLGHVDDVFALASELLRQQKKRMNQEQEILMKTRGVFKYVTSCYYYHDTSSKNEFVQVGYLDLEDNIVFSAVDISYVEDENKLIRYLPGFWVRGYNSCQEYLTSKDTKEIKEVISSTSIKYSPSYNSSNNKTHYSVIGYLNDKGELVYYNQIANKE